MAVLCEEHNRRWGICKTIPVTCSQCLLEAAKARIEEAVEQEKQRVIRIIQYADNEILPSNIRGLLAKLIQHIEEGRALEEKVNENQEDD
jgi:hypothetical protein